MKSATQVLMLGLCAGLAGCATSSVPTRAGTEAAGYLSPGQLAAVVDAVPAPSADGSSEQTTDRALSDRYRSLASGDRWLLATAHAELSPDLARQHFDCAMGVRFAGAPTPRLTAMFDKLMHDANGAAEQVKTRAFRPRPVGIDPDRPACVRLTSASRATAAYPSGSAAVGTAYAEALALIDPGHAAEVRRIGHEIGISRVVCAMHYPADIAPGEAIGRAVVADAAATPAFQADLQAARIELAGVRARGVTNPGCTAEAATLALPLPQSLPRP